MMNNQQRIANIDKIASQIIKNGGDSKDLLVAMINYSNDFYQVLKTSSKEEMNRYCQQYPGFYAYVRVLNDLALLTSQGKLPNTGHDGQTKSSGNLADSIKSNTNTNININKKSLDELQQIMTHALLQMQNLVRLNGDDQADLLPHISLFLLTIISTAADLVEAAVPGGSAYLYAEVEAGVKKGGLRSIAKAMKEKAPEYSVSGIDEDDVETAMNYLGQQLAITLTKALHELPKSLRSPETQLRSLEALLANLLSQKFPHAHETLDYFCEHVHTALNNLNQEKNVSKSIH